QWRSEQALSGCLLRSQRYPTKGQRSAQGPWEGASPVIEHVVSNHTGELNSTSNSVTMKPATIAKMSTPRGSPNVTSTALKSTPKAASVLPNTMQTSTSAMTTAHNTLLTSSATTIHSKESKGPKFDAGSFVGGIVLTLGALSIFYIGCRVYYSRRGIRYRSIDEHDAII
uniref:Porimin n=1 Tax=Nannospalax galili TaxID=1026970 RepID=A0A8C6Q9K8_NANGA